MSQTPVRLPGTQQSPSTARSWVQEAAVPPGAGLGTGRQCSEPPTSPVGRGRRFSGPAMALVVRTRLLVQGTQEAWVPSLRPGRCLRWELATQSEKATDRGACQAAVYGVYEQTRMERLSMRPQGKHMAECVAGSLAG